MGLTHFAVLSDGRKIASPKFLRRAEKKLRRAQRNLSRKQKGSRNRDKARIKVARAHARAADARRDFHHQLSTSLTCSACGVRDGPKPLHVRDWQCQGCGAWLDRDINAAVNVAKAAGLAVTACRAPVGPGPVLAQRATPFREDAGTHPKSPGESA